MQTATTVAAAVAAAPSAAAASIIAPIDEVVSLGTKTGRLLGSLWHSHGLLLDNSATASLRVLQRFPL